MAVAVALAGIAVVLLVHRKNSRQFQHANDQKFTATAASTASIKSSKTKIISRGIDAKPKSKPTSVHTNS